MLKSHLDKIASATRNAQIAREATIRDEVVAKAGYIIAGRVIGHKGTYNQLENLHGRLVRVNEGDVIAGVLGARHALHGYAGEVPAQIHRGDELQLLSLGGVIGRCTSINIDVGNPFGVEVLGAVLSFPILGERVGVPACISENALPQVDVLETCAPLVLVAGTCMNSGKTMAAVEIVRYLSRHGMKVAGAKLTGVSLMRDTLAMLDAGAHRCLDFTDTGCVSTDEQTAPGITRGILTALQKDRPDVIVVELGDGISGRYGVQTILSDPDLMRFTAVHVMCANDPVGAWGSIQMYRERFALGVDVVSGPVTDNEVGKSYIRDEIGVEAWNARIDAHQLGTLIETRLQAMALKKVPRP